MNLEMPDSIYPARLPAGYRVYLGYADGAWATGPTLHAKFPGRKIIVLTVTGATIECDGCDIENGDLSPESGAAWAQRKLAATPHSRPVLYASISRMPDVLDELGKLGITRKRVRLLSAHYGEGQHICGPDTCRYFEKLDAGTTPAMDGAQWSSSFPGLGGPIDMSLLGDTFFSAPAPAHQEDADVKVTVIRQGDSGQAVRNWQGLLVAHGYGYLLGGRPGGSVEQSAGVDGEFGPATEAATRKFQEDRKLDVNGTVAAAEWSAAVG